MDGSGTAGSNVTRGTLRAGDDVGDRMELVKALAVEVLKSFSRLALRLVRRVQLETAWARSSVRAAC